MLSEQPTIEKLTKTLNNLRGRVANQAKEKTVSENNS